MEKPVSAIVPNFLLLQDEKRHAKFKQLVIDK